MAHLAIAGSHSVNGVAALHTEILKHQVMKPFYELYPEKFSNKTNGITHRRWLLKANPRLANLITMAIGGEWLRAPEVLSALQDYTMEPSFQEAVEQVKRENKALWPKRSNINMDWSLTRSQF